jgi:uncharacterized protein YndB with AHSA1/START domain
MTNKPKFVYVIYIASTPEEVFRALTSAEISKQYWSGCAVVSDWKVGAPFGLKLTHQDKQITGEVLEFDPPKRLAYTFQPREHGVKDESASRVTFDIETYQDQVKLTVIHDGFEPGSKVYEAISRGWPHVLSSLKSYLESGKGMMAPWYGDDAARTAGAAR